LSDSFESTIADIARDQKRLAELKTTTTGRVDQKKKQLSDAIQKHTKAVDKPDSKKEGEQEEEKKTEAKEEKPKPVMADLFSMSPARPAGTETAAAATTIESETFGHDADEEVDHG
jgi:septal ring factor EnvC (AmiA/AmiB activator)